MLAGYRLQSVARTPSPVFGGAPAAFDAGARQVELFGPCMQANGRGFVPRSTPPKYNLLGQRMRPWSRRSTADAIRRRKR